ncbi:terpene synthase family protein [Streptomyces sp. PmtG]
MDRIALPSFHMPFDKTGRNPAAPEAHTRMWEWVDGYGLCPTPLSRRWLLRTAPDDCMAWYYPTLDGDSLTLFSEFCAWAFIVDDEFDDGASGRDPRACEAAVHSLLAVLHGSGPARGRLAEAAADLWDRLTPGRSASWIRTFRQDITAWLWTYYGETVDRLGRRLPAIDAFREHRRDAVGEPMFLDLCEIAARADLTDSVRFILAFRELRNAAAEQIGLYNDIWSATKERAVAYHHNSVSILAANDPQRLQDAAHAANAMVTDCVHRMVDAVRDLPAQLQAAGLDPGTRAAALATAEAYRVMVRGNYDYHYAVPRYTEPEDVDTQAPAHVANLFPQRL